MLLYGTPKFVKSFILETGDGIFAIAKSNLNFVSSLTGVLEVSMVCSALSLSKTTFSSEFLSEQADKIVSAEKHDR